MDYKVFQVSEINQYLKQQFDDDPLLSSICIQGEISNYKQYSSGHHYFSLKDDSSSIKCVMFRSSAAKLRFRPENGMQVLAVGKISVYPRDGAYQLYCEYLMINGVGDLHAAFEQLKSKLEAEGLFSEAHKKRIPVFPKRIGLITSDSGAAVHDMIRIIRARYPIAQVVLIPSLVQGTEAPQSIVRAIQLANAMKIADVLIVGRGGGSAEDLWAYNFENVARAIYESDIPVISAVGHEPDVTIADYVADLRAATPSNGAELATPDRIKLMEQLDSSRSMLSALLTGKAENARAKLRQISSNPVFTKPETWLGVKRQLLDELYAELTESYEGALATDKNLLSRYAAALDAMSPLKVLARGYSMTTDSEGALISEAGSVHTDDELKIRLSDGLITANVKAVEVFEHE